MTRNLSSFTTCKRDPRQWQVLVISSVYPICLKTINWQCPFNSTSCFSGGKKKKKLGLYGLTRQTKVRSFYGTSPTPSPPSQIKSMIFSFRKRLLMSPTFKILNVRLPREEEGETGARYTHLLSIPNRRTTGGRVLLYRLPYNVHTLLKPNYHPIPHNPKERKKDNFFRREISMFFEILSSNDNNYYLQIYDIIISKT